MDARNVLGGRDNLLGQCGRSVAANDYCLNSVMFTLNPEGGNL